AAQDRPPAPGQLALDRSGERSRRGDRPDAQEQADQQQPQALESGGEIASRDPPGGRPGQGSVQEPALSLAMRPSARVTTRSQRRARASSWVIITRVAPASARRANRRSMI